jgi:hypothetical protein
MRLIRGQESSSIRSTRIAGQNLRRVFDDGVDGRPIGLAVQHADPRGEDWTCQSGRNVGPGSATTPKRGGR